MSEQTTPNCINVQRALLSDPGHTDTPIQQHLNTCHRCRQFAHDISSFDTDIHAGMNIKVPDLLAAKSCWQKVFRKNDS